jgi:chromate transporter
MGSSLGPSAQREAPGFGTAFWVWARIGLLSFGGPAGQIALMHSELVERRSWLSERGFLDALNFCMLLPGPEAMQIATYCGWRLHGLRGGLAAGLWFVLPGAALIALLAGLYLTYGTINAVQLAFLGIKAAVLVLVVQAFWRIARRALAGLGHWSLAAASFLGLFVLTLPYPLVIGLAAALGLVLRLPERSEWRWGWPAVGAPLGAKSGASSQRLRW